MPLMPTERPYDGFELGKPDRRLVELGPPAGVRERRSTTKGAHTMSTVATSTDETYNGWKNYPTWAVNLWLANDEPLYREALERTGAIVAETESRSEFWTLEESHRFATADMLKEWVTDELAPDLGASFAADLLGYALGCVDWHEIADAWIESARDA